jgi:hypothetical protein
MYSQRHGVRAKITHAANGIRETLPAEILA